MTNPDVASCSRPSSMAHRPIFHSSEQPPAAELDPVEHLQDESSEKRSKGLPGSVSLPLNRIVPNRVGVSPREDKQIDGVRRVTYAQNQDKRDFFIKVATILPLSGRVGKSPAPFRGRRTNPSTPRGCKNGQSGKTAA